MMSSITNLNLSMQSPSGPPERSDFNFLIARLISILVIGMFEQSVLVSWAEGGPDLFQGVFLGAKIMFKNSLSNHYY